MRILYFHDEDSAPTESVQEILNTLVSKGMTLETFDPGACQVLDDDETLSQITYASLGTIRLWPDLIISFNNAGLIPWLYESLRIHYVDWLIEPTERELSSLESPELQIYVGSDLFRIFCDDDEVADRIREIGFIENLIQIPYEVSSHIQIEKLVHVGAQAAYSKKHRHSMSANCLLRLASQLTLDAKWENAVLALSGAMERGDSNEEAFYLLNAIQEWKGDRKLAREQIQKNLETLDDEQREQAVILRSEAYCTLGLGQERGSFFEEALESYQKAIRLNPESFLAFNNLGALLLRAENVEMAEQCFQRAIIIKEDYSPTYFNLALLYEQSGRIQEAIASAETFMDLLSESEYSLLASGRALLERLEANLEGSEIVSSDC